MFNTPYNDQRLKNKDEVLALRFKSNPREQLAISAKYLKKNPVYMESWTLSESKLASADGQELKRLPYNRAFWFGWHATYPNSRLVK